VKKEGFCLERKKIEVSESEIEIQEQFIEKIRQNTSEKFFMIVTYGCQMNAHDSEKLAGMLSQMGYTETDDKSKTDLILYNTCCVRENAENRVFGNLGYLKSLKRSNKNLKIILCGCMMQQDAVVEKVKQSYKHVDIIFGTYNLHRLPQLLWTNMETNNQIIDVWAEHKEIVEDLPSIRLHSFKASTNIMYGCNNYCTYCIVPYVRGRERSRRMEDILKDIKDLVSDGVKEITLLGQNVNSYGKELQVTFATLIREINKIEGLERIRFMTSHPKDLSDELIDAIVDCEKVCRHLHLPIQSGSNAILEKMNRGYTREYYISLINKIKAKIPDMLFTTDIIVGFPSETDEDNDKTISLMKEIRFSNAYTFLYSPRSGTKATTMDGQVSEETATMRFNKLLGAIKPISNEINQGMKGSVQKVLVESLSKNDDKLLSGRLDNNLIVHFQGEKELIGNIVEVKITDCKTFYLIGERI